LTEEIRQVNHKALDFLGHTWRLTSRETVHDLVVAMHGATATE
jgi:hypothetical protein